MFRLCAGPQQGAAFFILYSGTWSCVALLRRPTAQEVHDMLVKEIHNESQLINNRMTWMTASLSILMNAFVQLLTKAGEATGSSATQLKRVSAAICVVGMLVPIFVLLGVWGAILGEFTWHSQLHELAANGQNSETPHCCKILCGFPPHQNINGNSRLPRLWTEQKVLEYRNGQRCCCRLSYYGIPAAWCVVWVICLASVFV